MFSFFKKQPILPKYSDRIWLSAKAKELNMLALLKTSYTDKPVLIISAFEQTLAVLAHNLDAIGLVFRRAKTLEDTKFLKGFVLVHSDLFLHDAAVESVDAPYVFFLEHYPLADRDNLVIQRVGDFYKPSQIVFLMSIDDPLFEAVGSDRIRMILQQMGMDANETIEHSLISASIGRAQAKFCKIVHTERISDNETQWYAWNIGDKYQGA